MIGQKNLIKQIDWMCKAGCFPRFAIITGDGEKEQLATYVASKLETFVSGVIDNKIETIRAVIEQSYKTHAPVTYIIKDADTMSIQAKNAMLKVTEEPPNNAYFIMLLDDLNNALDTIRSRAVIFTLEPYSRKELLEYFDSCNYGGTTEYKKIVTDLCNTPAEIDLLQSYGADKFYAYVAKVVDNIAVVSGANAFKISDKIALKDEPDKYDLKLFWKAFISVCAKKRLYDVNAATSKALKKLGIRGVNRQMLFDEWLLSIRKIWR